MLFLFGIAFRQIQNFYGFLFLGNRMYLNRLAVDRFPVRASPPSPPARAAAPRPEPPPRSAAPPSAPAAAQESIRTTAQPAPLASPATPAALAIAIHLAVLAPVRPSRGGASSGHSNPGPPAVQCSGGVVREPVQRQCSDCAVPGIPQR